jgi:hypothetical protein
MGIVSDQVILFCLLGAIFAMFVWGKVRYDLVAFGGLVLAVVIGVVPGEQAFSGFGHQATVIIALVLIVSRGLSNSGAIELVARHVVDAGRSLFGHISLMACVSAAMSAVMNNVAALALLMPIDIQAQAQRGIDPDAAVLCVDSGRYDHADRYSSQYHHRQLSGKSGRRALRYVRLHAGWPRNRVSRHRFHRLVGMASDPGSGGWERG